MSIASSVIVPARSSPSKGGVRDQARVAVEQPGQHGAVVLRHVDAIWQIDPAGVDAAIRSPSTSTVAPPGRNCLRKSWGGGRGRLGNGVARAGRWSLFGWSRAR